MLALETLKKVAQEVLRKMSATAVEDAFAAVKTFLWNERDVFGVRISMEQ